MKAHIVGLGSEGIHHFDNIEALKEGAAKLGYEFVGLETSKHLRPVLQGQPKFRNLIGPQYGGDVLGEPQLRYETAKAYEFYSR